MKKTRVALLPLMVSAAAPGPVIVRFLAITSSLLKVMVLGLGKAKVIVSPGAASAMACRKEPGPLSLVLVTLIVAAWTGRTGSASPTMRQSSSARLLLNQ
jgi:hypothetical protein